MQQGHSRRFSVRDKAWLVFALTSLVTPLCGVALVFSTHRLRGHKSHADLAGISGESKLLLDQHLCVGQKNAGALDPRWNSMVYHTGEALYLLR